MDQPDREAEPHFSRPIRQILLMLIVLGLTGAGGSLVLQDVRPVFEANPYLNGFIAFVFIIGILICFWQVLLLINSVRWIKRFAVNDPGHDLSKTPQLLAPLASQLRTRAKRMQISSTSTRSMLDSVAARVDEDREITRYIVNMLIFLGLLGTFYGLATTVPAVVDTIRSLAPQEGEGGVEVFSRLMEGLESQLGGMGIAFSSSLLGLAGSLIVGLLELFVSHGQNRFYRELEEWLSSFTRVSFMDGDGEGGLETAAVATVLDQLGEQMEALRTMFAQTDHRTSQVDERLGALTDNLERLADQITVANPATMALDRVVMGQERLIDAIENQAQHEGMDAESRMRLRSIDVQMLHILEEISAGRQETMAELRTDLASLTRAVTQAQAASPLPQGRLRRKPDPGSEG